MSTFNDDFCIFGLKESTKENISASCLCSHDNIVVNDDDTHGDLMLHTCHLIEMVTKVVMVFGQSMSSNCVNNFGGEFGVKVVFSNE